MKPDEQVQRRQAWLVALLALLASAAFEIACSQSPLPVAALVVRVLCETAILGLGQRFLAHRAHHRSWFVWMLPAFGTTPMVVAILSRGGAPHTLALEVPLLDGFRYVVLALGAVATTRSTGRTAAASASMLMIFALSLGQQRAVSILMLVFTLLGLLWLAADYWSALQGRLVAQERRSSVQLNLWRLAFPLLVLLLALAVPSGRDRLAALAGFMPSSGGVQHTDSRARGGIGDGDALVAARQKPQSFGPIESDVFLESDQSSIYDVFDEAYGDPPKNRKTDRSVSLPPNLKEGDRSRIAQQQRGGREFSVVREPAPLDRQLADRPSRAVLHVVGRVPVHLRLMAYDLFDGEVWLPEELGINQRLVQLQNVGEAYWVDGRQPSLPQIWRGTDRHALRINRLKGNRVPGPPLAVGYHIDRVDQANFYCWAQDGVLALNRDDVPGYTVINTISRPRDERLLNDVYPAHEADDHARRMSLGGAEGAALESLADTWTAGIPWGWPQVAAICEHLRTEYTLDRAAAQPDPPSGRAVHEFLFETKRGPEYLFASAATLLLRSKGYSVRLASGFYARPERYDPAYGQTSVLISDAHVWAEVQYPGGQWVTVEASPGYEVLGPAPTLWERIDTAALAVWEFTRRHIVGLTSGLLVAGFVIYSRRALTNHAATLALLAASGVVRAAWLVRCTVALLEFRGATAGRPRRPAVSAVRWLRSLPRVAAWPGRDAFIHLVEWHWYGTPAIPAPCDEQQVRALCRQALAQWRVAALRPPQPDASRHSAGVLLRWRNPFQKLSQASARGS